MTPREEIEAINKLAMDITDLGGISVHFTSCGSEAVNVTVFNEQDDIDWQVNLYSWSRDEAYLPKLRWLRNELEQMLAEARAERQELAA